MKIEALCSINSGQYNRGDVFDTTPAAAQELIDNGHAAPYLEKKAIKSDKPQEDSTPKPLLSASPKAKTQKEG